jgi:hypothetical protein
VFVHIQKVSVEQTEEWKFIDPLNSSVAFAIKNSGEEAVGAQGEVLSFFLEKFIYCRSHSAFHKINNVQSFQHTVGIQSLNC